jgi:methyl-accepting chemotaxis protein WspA
MMRFADLQLTTKLTALVAVCLFGFGLFAVLSWQTLERLEVSGPVYNQIIQNKDIVADVLPPPKYIIESYLVVLQLCEATNPNEVARLLDRSNALRNDYNSRHSYWLQRLQPGELRTDLLDASHRPAVDFFDVRDREFVPLLATDRDKAKQLANGRLKVLYDEHRTAIDRVVSRATSEGTALETESTELITSRGRLLFMLGIAVAAIIVGIGVLTTRIARSLTNRIHVATLAATQVAAGDLTVSVPVGEDDETGKLLSAIRTMTSNLNSLVVRVKKSSIELMSTATELGATSKTQDATVQNFGASTNQIAAAVREISATSLELLSRMDSVSKIGSETAVLAERGRTSVGTMENTMRQLDKSTVSISAKLSAIREKAADINVVVTTITKVADQTNLLSVNAAIEAEKAGEYGLGFIVLAREIRRLADQTAVATLDIAEIVKQMQGAVSTGVMEMDKFSEEVKRGVGTVDTVGSQLGQVIAQVQTLTSNFDTVAEAMRTQSQGAGQISDAMLQLTSGARQTTAALREFDNATTHLRDAVGDLKQEISHFKVVG